ncbi:ATP-binding cassette domain-containing protein, partial [Streptomyces sp. T-3]|nr:ATP-binding cassette domain-containing protein [Streptomyces sp. T-3]
MPGPFPSPGPFPPVAPAVHAEGVVKRFGPTLALDDARLTVAAGESHALVGRNGAGKSTLVHVLTGLHPPDAGTVLFDGEPAPPFGETAAWQSKVACVYQKSMVVPELTVAENLFLNRFEPGEKCIHWSRLRARARALLSAYGVEVDPGARAKDLAVEQRQFVEIARALSFGARLIILDEPTAQLDARGIQRLFTRLRELQAQGVAFLYISHHLQEVYELCSTVTVYRDARPVLTAPVAGLPKAELVAAMTGDERSTGSSSAVVPVRGHGAVPSAVPVRGHGAADVQDAPLLRTEDLTLDGEFEPLGIAVRPGEVLGLAGAAASGNIALGEVLAGMRAP